MLNPDYDLIVVGGSANGLQTAISAGQEGLKVAVIEEHSSIGFPEHCSGLFSYYGLKLLDILPPDDVIMNPDVYGSRIISPNGKMLTVRKKEKHALVADRAAFDQYLMQKAKSHDVEFYLSHKAISANRNKELIDITIQGKDKLTLTSKILVSAEGVRGNISRQLGLEPPTPKYVVNAAQFYMNNLQNVDSELVEVIQYQKYAKNFFAWVVPTGHNSAKIGLGTSSRGASKILAKMIQDHPVMREHVEGADLYRKTAGRIPIHGPVKKTYADNFIIVGDVAGQTKPTTGGGVIIGGIAAKIAGKIVAQAVENNNFKKQFLRNYEKQWKKEIQKDLKFMNLVRTYMNKLNDEEVNQFFAMLEDQNIINDIETYGHVDKQSMIVMKLMKSIKLYPFYLKTLPRLLSSVKVLL